jgi:polyisoprenoid-binding protein YceI
MNNPSDKQTATTTRTRWALDPAHSEVTFKVKHMMITNVTGKLTDYNVEAYTDKDDFSNAEVTFVGKLASINTGNEQRDEHLRSADFFDVENNAEVVFKATDYSMSGDDITLEGDLTIRYQTHRARCRVQWYWERSMGKYESWLYRKRKVKPKGFWVDLERRPRNGRCIGRR